MHEQDNLLIIYGGAFDPVHNGHVDVVKHLQTRYPNAIIHIIPCKQPTHKQACYASTEDRLEMLSLVFGQMKNVIIDTREIDRQTESYMILTAQSLQAEYPDKTLALCIGADAYADFESWYQYKELLASCNLIIVQRSGYSNEITANKHIDYLAVNTCDISSTSLREQFSKQDYKSNQIPPSVLAFIKARQLYLVT